MYNIHTEMLVLRDPLVLNLFKNYLIGNKIIFNEIEYMDIA